MSHEAQCLFCQHARRDTSKPLTRATIGKTRLPVPTGDTEARAILAVLMWQSAATRRCPSYERIKLEPDAYFAQDAPR